MDAAGEVAQLVERVARLLPGLAHQLGGALVALGRTLLGHPQRQRQRHQPLLRAVVEVALQPPALGVRGGDHTGPGAAQLGAPRR